VPAYSEAAWSAGAAQVSQRVRQNNKMQLTSGGLNSALRAPSSMRRLPLNLVFGGLL